MKKRQIFNKGMSSRVSSSKKKKQTKNKNYYLVKWDLVKIKDHKTMKEEILDSKHVLIICATDPVNAINSLYNSVEDGYRIVLTDMHKI